MHELCMRDVDWKAYLGSDANMDLAEVVDPPPAALEAVVEADPPGEENGSGEDLRCGAQAVPHSEEPCPTGATDSDVSCMSVRQLKEFLSAGKVDWAGCLEKADLVALALRTPGLTASAPIQALERMD